MVTIVHVVQYLVVDQFSNDGLDHDSNEDILVIIFLLHSLSRQT